MLTPPPFEQLLGDGFATVAAALPQIDRQSLVTQVEALEGDSRLRGRGGYRDLFSVLPSVRALAQHPAVHCWPAALLGRGAFAVRAILFDKTADANWKVTWHQDLTIQVRERRDVPGFDRWSEKAGIAHVQPPAAVLERMLTVRLHLDVCDASNGPVRVLPGTHRHGRLTSDQVDAFKASTTPVDATCEAGGLLLMRPLVLHSSSAASRPGHRRVIHLEYAVDDLPGGLTWHEKWGPSPGSDHG